MFILGGTASEEVAKDLSKLLNWRLVKKETKRFPDDELYLRILDDISNKDVVIVQTTYPDPNIIELFLLQDAAKEAGAKKIIVVIPYFGYARQDKKFELGEPVSAKALAQLISLKADKVITVDPHKDYLLDFFAVPSFSCTAVDVIAHYLKSKDLDLVLAPDKGALERAKKASGIIHCDFDYMEKTRIDGTTVKIKPKNLDVENKNVGIIDDIISTGGTMAKSIKELKKQGARNVYVSCTHGIFAQGAVKKLNSAGCDEIISTDSIISDFSKVKIADCIYKKLKEQVK